MSELFSLAEASLTLADFVEEFETEYGCGLLSCVSVDDRRDPAGQWRLFIEPWDDESAAHAIGLLDSLEGGVPFTVIGHRWYRALGEYREFKTVIEWAPDTSACAWGRLSALVASEEGRAMPWFESPLDAGAFVGSSFSSSPAPGALGVAQDEEGPAGGLSAGVAQDQGRRGSGVLACADSSPSDAASLVGLGAVGGDRTGGGGSLPIPSPCMPCERPGSGSISTGAAPRASSSPVSRLAPEACERFQPVGEEAFEEVERLLVRASVLLGRAAGLLKRERSGR